MGDLASVRERGEENPNFALFFPFLGSFFGCEHGGFLEGKGQSLRERERETLTVILAGEWGGHFTVTSTRPPMARLRRLLSRPLTSTFCHFVVM